MTTRAAVLATVLLASVGACDQGPVLELVVLEGTWANEDTATRGTTQIRFRVRDDVLLIEGWGACHPVDCYWGTEVANTENWEANGELRVVWDHGFAVQTQVVKRLSDVRLRVATSTHFTDDSGRPDMERVEFFRKQ